MIIFICRPFIYLAVALLLGIAIVISHGASAAGESGSSSSSAPHHPDLDYLKAVNSVAPPRRVGVSANGGVFEHEPAGRGYGIFLGATEGIRLSPDGCSKGALSERHRIVARAARILHLVAAPRRLRQRNNRYIGTSQATNRRAGFRRELDCGHWSCR